MNHHTDASGWGIAGAAALFVLALAMWLAVAALLLANRLGANRRVRQGAATVVVVGAVSQIGHLQEHVAQVGYWVAHPESKPWMTPWASSMSAGYGAIDESRPGLGMEILHFIGNSVFLAGLVGVLIITSRSRHVRARKWGRMGVWMQGLHGLEHLVLMLSVWFGASRPIGVSTWFGLMDPGPGLWTYRIWWHFLANVVGSVVFAGACWHLWQERSEVSAGFEPDVAGASGRGRRRHGVLVQPALARGGSA